MIDFIVTWIDGDDPNWQDEFCRYSTKNENEDKKNIRYRSWDNLQYWFRGIEKFAPWVNKIHFITWGHFPKWLNINHPKLNLVNHSDFIPREYLPTFNSRVIELNMHRIKGLAEQFVYFNDDMFLIKPINPAFFFKELPCDIAALNTLSFDDTGHAIFNDMVIINKHFNRNEVIYTNFFKWFNLKYGKNFVRTLCLLSWPRFTGFYNPHLPQPFLKSIIETVWKQEEVILHTTCHSKFRQATDVNPYLFRYWQLVSGNFNPISFSNRGVMINCKNDTLNNAVNFIMKQRMPLLCINDGNIENFEIGKKKINEAFETIFPDKSSFENC
jgi:hypothetical protein